MATPVDIPDFDHVLRLARSAGLPDENLSEPLREALEGKSAEPLLAWARARGVLHAQSGEKVKTAIEETMSLSRVVKRLNLDGSEASLGSALVSAAVEGYMGAADGAVEDSVPIEHLQDQVAELTAVHRVISAANSTLKLNDMLQETAQAVVAVTHADICSIFIYEPERDHLLLTATSDPDTDPAGQVRLQLGEGITGWAAMAGVPVAVRHAAADPRFQRASMSYEDKAASILAVPVVLFTITHEKLVGVITIRTFRERDFSENEIKFLETVAGEIAIAIENAQLYEQTDSRLRQKVAELTTLQGVSAHIAATLNLSEVLSLIAHQAAHLVHADAAAIYVLTPEAGTLDLVAHYNLRDPSHNTIHDGKIGPRISLPVGQSTVAQAVLRGIPQPLPPDADAHLGLTMASEGYRSLFCVPLIAPRSIMGGICLYDMEEGTFSEEEVHLLEAFANEAAIAIENSRLYDAAVRGLQIKSALLQEMNHRVRNNMQTVAGLLSMQLRRIPADNEAATVVRESIARIQSMAAVHDLMVGGNVETTSIYDLAKQVAEAAVSTLSKPDFDLKLMIGGERIDEIQVDSYRATLLALLFNELISNAILHGFKGRKRGVIDVRAWIDDADDAAPNRAPVMHSSQPTINIEVMDNGVGLPKGFDMERDANLGLSIVRTMVVSDLRGCFEIKPGKGGHGTIASIRFTQSRSVYQELPPPIG